MGFCFLIFLLSFGTSAAELKLTKVDKEPDTISRIRTLSSKYKKDQLTDELRAFIEVARQGRVVGTPTHDEAFKYLQKRVGELSKGEDTKFYVHEFKPDLGRANETYENDFKTEIAARFKSDDPEYKKWRSFTDEIKKFLTSLKEVKGQNLIWQKKGSLPVEDTLIIAVNYDTISLDSEKMELNLSARAPGADDNGSGVAIALALIDILSQINLPKTVRIAFFDFQEFASLGSYAYAKEIEAEIKSKQIKGVINLLMLGHDSKFSDALKKEGNMKAYIRAGDHPSVGADKLFADSVMSVAAKVSPSVRYELASNASLVSDQKSFWDAGVPAVVFTGDWENDFNPRNHTKDDFVETINQKTFYNNLRYALGAVLGWAYDIVP